jgi:serine/threonine-protein kinase
MKLVNAETAALIDHFRKPCTIARAVARLSRGTRQDENRILEEVLPVLLSLVSDGLLAEAGSEAALSIQATFHPGDLFGEWSIVSVTQLVDDVEVYQVRNHRGSFGALKIGMSCDQRSRNAIEHESRILTSLPDGIAPRLLESGTRDGRAFTLTQWFHGVPADVAFAEFHGCARPETRRRLHELGNSVLNVYERLHQQGTIHGDVQPANVLIDASGKAALVDFGWAERIINGACASTPATGGAVVFFSSPECARASLHGGSFTPSFLAEQYSLAALLYLLATGSQYIKFALEKRKALAQIISEPVVPFADWGVSSWPELECVLARALKKNPQDRFASVSEFARAWASIKLLPDARPSKRSDLVLDSVRADFLRSAAPGGPIWELSSGTTASVTYGSAGVADALYSIACSSDSAEAFALADAWAERAIARIGSPGAFDNPGLGIAPGFVAPASLYHGEAGACVVRARIARARGDSLTQQDAVRAFLEATNTSCPEIDLTLGRAGTLLGAAMLLDDFVPAKEDKQSATRATLLALGNDLLTEIWKTLESYAPAAEAADLSNLGIAHGWAGLLYASLCWCAAVDAPLPRGLYNRLHELEECSVPSDRGAMVAWENSTAGFGDSYMPGWCNGSAGYVFLWDEAYQATGTTAFLDLSARAAWNVWERKTHNPSLCCGAAGQAYALLRAYRRTRDGVWLNRARALAERAVLLARDERKSNDDGAGTWLPESLYRGGAGIAALCAAIDNPENACMPMFEREGAGIGSPAVP